MKKALTAVSFCSIFFITDAFSQASVSILSTPSYSSYPGTIYGKVGHVVPAACKVAVLIFIEGLGWYSKPFYNPNYVSINTVDSSWSCNVTTGGQQDALAT